MHDVAPARRLAPAATEEDGVSFVMPVLNERRYLENAVRTVLAQLVDGPVELIIALGPSSDGTSALAHAIADAEERVTIVDNPRADIPVGLNLAIAASRYPTIVRVDAHSELPEGYTRRAISTLSRTRAANVGGVMHAEGRTPFQRAVARAYNAPIGLGGGAYHGSRAEGEAESAYLGVMRRAVLDEVGGFDETIRRGEDWELNLRIRRLGYRVWFDPDLAVTYWPRESWARLARQFVATGTWRGELVRRYGRRNQARYFAPPALVVTVAAALVVGALRVAGVLGRGSRAVRLVAVPIASYSAIVAGNALGPGGGRGLRDRLWTLAVVPTMHLAWGAGFIAGLFTGAGGTVDTSRLDGRNTPLP